MKSLAVERSVSQAVDKHDAGVSRKVFNIGAAMNGWTVQGVLPREIV